MSCFRDLVHGEFKVYDRLLTAACSGPAKVLCSQSGSLARGDHEEIRSKNPTARAEVLKKFRSRGDYGDELACEPFRN